MVTTLTVRCYFTGSSFSSILSTLQLFPSFLLVSIAFSTSPETHTSFTYQTRMHQPTSGKNVVANEKGRKRLRWDLKGGCKVCRLNARQKEKTRERKREWGRERRRKKQKWVGERAIKGAHLADRSVTNQGKKE